jgi:hypothetical protein
MLYATPRPANTGVNALQVRFERDMLGRRPMLNIGARVGLPGW